MHSEHEYTVLLGVVIAGYATALLASYILVRWVLPARQTRDTHRYLALDGIRGYLALGVFFGHSMGTWMYLQTGLWQGPAFNFTLQIGKGSVAMFFMITAFLFWGRVLEAKNHMDWNKFFMSRVFRIYPLYIFAFSIILITVGYKSGWYLNESLGRILFETFRWMAFRHPDINKLGQTQLIIAGVNWTLEYELWFYLALPLIAGFLILKHPLWRRLAYGAVAAALFIFFRLSFGIGVTFVGGIAAAYWVRDPEKKRLAQGRIAALVGATCFLTAFFFVHEPFGVAALVLYTTFFVVISSGNSLFGLLSTRAALWLGEISYSIYLLHGVVLWVVMQNIYPTLPVLHNSPQTYALTTLAMTPIVILISSASFLLIEKPGIALGKTLANKYAATA